MTTFCVNAASKSCKESLANFSLKPNDFRFTETSLSSSKLKYRSFNSGFVCISAMRE